MNSVMKVFLLLIATAFGALWLVQGSVTATTYRCLSPLTARRSVESNGLEANAPSGASSISADGSFVAFESVATNLVANDTNPFQDIFVNESMAAPQTTLISVSYTGGTANGSSRDPNITPDGRYVAFVSSASNLVPNDTNFRDDIFVRDRLNGTTELVSMTFDKGQSNGYSYNPSISGDGTKVAFMSDANNLVPYDTNGRPDVFVYDLTTDTIERVSVNNSNQQADGESYMPSISGDGLKVSFHSSAPNLVSNDTNFATDVFVRDLSAGTTTLVSVDSFGFQGNNSSYDSEISKNGNFVTFESTASNLVPGDTNFVRDVFVHNLSTSETKRVSINTNGIQGNGSSIQPTISGDGNIVAFASIANNLIAFDTNFDRDIFVHDMMAGTTYRVTVNANSDSAEPAISADGLRVSYTSYATNLIAIDTNGVDDVFVSTTFCEAIPSSVNLQLVEQVRGSNLLPLVLATLGLLLVTVAVGTFKASSARKPLN